MAGAAQAHIYMGSAKNREASWKACVCVLCVCVCVCVCVCRDLFSLPYSVRKW